jgi:TonB-dependent SusC/RagA subfamily outer membrane receptor
LTSEPDTLIVSHIGYKEKRVAIQGQSVNPLMIKLEASSTQLREVTVSTGYQHISKERATGSFDFVDNKLLNRGVSSGILARLKGIASGLSFNQSTYIPGGIQNNQSKIAIRGRSTIYANPSPLIVVNNFPYDGDLSTINPDDVESITILKDAAAASIWGAYSGNGVIVITTKSGKFRQPLKVSFGTNITIGNKPDIFYTPTIHSKDYIIAEEYLFKNGYYNNQITAWNHPALPPAVEILIQQKNGIISPSQAELQLMQLGNLDIRKDEYKYFYRKSINQQYGLNLSGGDNIQRYYFSVGYDKDLSNVNGNNNNRITINASNTYSILRKKIELTTAVTYTQEKTEENGITKLPVGYPYLTLADSLGRPIAIPYEHSSTYLDTVGGGKLLDWHYYPLEEVRGNERNKQIWQLLIERNTISFTNHKTGYKGFEGNNRYQKKTTGYKRRAISVCGIENYESGRKIHERRN